MAKEHNLGEGLVYREASIDGIKDKEGRLVNVSFSSEASIEDWRGCYNVLGHNKDEVDLTRIKKNGPVLLGHNLSRHVGCVVNAWLDEKERKCRAEIKISRTDAGNEVWLNIEDGILTGISVGSEVFSKVLVSEKDGVRNYRSTKWSPYEISLTPVPADLSVGVGRSFMADSNNEENRATEEVARNGVNPPVTTETQETQRADSTQQTAPGASVVAESARGLSTGEIGQITRIGREYGFSSQALDAIERSERPDQFMERCLKLARENNSEASVSANRDSKLDLNKRDATRFSVAKLVRAQAFPNNKKYQEAAAFERECTRALGAEEGSSLSIPSEVMRTWGGVNRVAGSINVGTGGAMNGLVEDHLMFDSFVGMLRAESEVLQRVSMRSGLSGNRAYPVQTGQTKASWTGIDKALAQTDAKVEKRAITPSKLGAILKIDESALIFAATAVEQDLRRDITEAIAYEMMRVIFYGSGTGDEPAGLSVNTGINKVKFASAMPTFAELTNMHTKIKAKLAARGNLFYSLNSAMEGHFLTTPRENGMQSPILSESGSKLNGRDYEATELINEGHIFYGNFAEVFVGIWDTFKIDVNPYSKDGWEANSILLKAYQIAGITVRRPEAFCLGSV